jgi:poly(A) polymerase
VPSARLFDELLKLLLSGHAVDCIQRLRQEKLHQDLLPFLDAILGQDSGERFVMQALKNTDQRVRVGKTVSPAFLFATLTWHEVRSRWQAIQARGVPSIPALHEAMDGVIQEQTKRIAIPRRFTSDMKDLWLMQQRFEQRSGQRPFRLLEHPRFRAGYDFLLLRCDSGELDPSLGEWWTAFQEADTDARVAMLVTETKTPNKKRRRRRKPAASAAAAIVAEG